MKTETLAAKLRTTWGRNFFPVGIKIHDFNSLSERERKAWYSVARLASRLLNKARYRRMKKKQNNETQNGKIRK